MFVDFDLWARKAQLEEFFNYVKVISGDQTGCLQNSDHVSLFQPVPQSPFQIASVSVEEFLF